MRKGRHEIESVGTLECENRVTARVVVAHKRSHPVERGKALAARRAQHFGTGIEFERKSADRAQRLGKKRDAAPAAGAEPVGLANRGTAGGTERRKNKVQQT